MTRRGTNRRALLRAAAGVTGGLLAGASGCVGIPGDDAPDDPAGAATDLRLLPSPSAFGGRLAEKGYSIDELDVSALLEHGEQFPPESLSTLKRNVGSHFLVEDARDVDAVVTGTTVTETLVGFEIRSGSFDPERQREVLRTDKLDYEKRTTYGDVEIYEVTFELFGEELKGSIALEADATTQFTTRPESSDGDWPDPVAGMKAILDARREAAERYVQSSGAVAALVDTLSAEPELYADLESEDVEVRDFPPVDGTWAENVVAHGTDTRIEGSTAVAGYAFVGPEGDPPPVEPLERAVREDEDPVPGFEDVTVESTGRTVVVRGRMPTAGVKVTPRSLRFVQPPPDVALEFGRDAAEGTVRIEHAGGEAITAENAGAVDVGIDDDDWKTWFNRYRDDPDPVEVGDAVTVSAEPGDAVTVEWFSHGLNLKRTIGEFTVPGEG